MSRRFVRDNVTPANSDYVTMNPGAAPVGGPFTLAIVFKIDNFSGDRDLVRAETAGSSLIWALNNSGGALFMAFGGSFRQLDTLQADTWYLLILTKAAGTSQLRSHLCKMADDTWTHIDYGTLADPAGPIDHIWIGRAFGSYLTGYVAALALGAVNLSNAASMALRPGLAAWVSAGLGPIWRLNDTPIADLSGGSGSQRAIQGTTVNTAVEPPSFDYSISTTPPSEPEPEPSPEDQREGSWEQWLDAIRTGSSEYHYYKNRERDNPVECPNDGEPLQIGPDGQLYCRYDGWRPAGVTSADSSSNI